MKVVAYGIGGLFIASGVASLLVDSLNGETSGIVTDIILAAIGLAVICFTRPKNSLPYRIGKVIVCILAAFMLVGLIFGVTQMLSN